MPLGIKPEGCKGCWYEHDGVGFNKAHPAEATTPQPAIAHRPLLFVGEALGKNEADEGINFCGGSGSVLKALCAEVGIVMTDANITNVVKCRPPNNEEPHPNAILHCAKYLQEETVNLKPNLIVGFGNVPLRWFIPALKHEKSGVMKRRGSRYQTPFGKFMCLLHPAAVMRVREKLWPITRRDLKEAKKESTYAELRYEEVFDWWPTMQTIRDLCVEAGVRGYVVCDIETSFGDGLVRVGLGWKDRAISVPLIHGGGDSGPYYSNEQEREVVALLADLFANPEVTKSNHNWLSYDRYQLANIGFVFGGRQDDTIVQHHVLVPELEHKLEKVASVHSKVPYYKDEAKGRGEMSKQDPNRVGQYNCKDVKATDECDEDMTFRLKGLGLWNYYDRVALPMQSVVCEALRRRGVYLDPLVHEMRALTLGGEIEIAEEYIKSVTWPGFNPGTNSGDIPKLFHDVWGYPVQGWTEKTHKPKADEDTFLRIKEMAEPAHAALLDLMLDYRGSVKLKSTWVEGFIPEYDGRLHAEWLAWRARTARLASYPNVQNLPTSDGGEARKLFVCQFDDCEYVQLDRRQGEWRIQAILSGDVKFLEMFERFDEYTRLMEEARLRSDVSSYSKYKDLCWLWEPHARNAMDMWNCSREEVTTEKRFRGKIFFYGISYGGSTGSVIAKGGRGLSRSTAKQEEMVNLVDNLFKNHPEWTKWREETVTNIKTKRFMEFQFEGDMKWERQFFGLTSNIGREALDAGPQTYLAYLVNRTHIPIELWCQKNLKDERMRFGSWGPVLQLHDGIITEQPTSTVEEYLKFAIPLCEEPWEYGGKKWVIPVEVKRGHRFNELR